MITYSIIQKSQLEGAKRLDAEYYQPEYLEIIKELSKHKISKFKDILNDIRYGLYVEPDYQKEGIDFLRALNLVDYGIDGEILKIKKEEIPNDKYLLKEGDTLIVRSGANTGNVGIIEKHLENATFGSYTIYLKTTKVNPYFFYIFLNSKFGKLQTLRIQTGMAQPNLNIPNIEEIKIPIDIKIESQKTIENIVLEAFKIKENSKLLYQQAENLLLEELGLKNFDAEENLSSVINLSEIKLAKRMDAEYFQGEYKKIIDVLENYKGGWDYLENLTKFINNGNQPPYSEDGEIKFFSQKWIKNKGIDYSFLTDENEPRVLKSFFEDKKNASYLIRKNDILYYSVGANLGYCHNYLEDENIAIGSFINLIRADESKINPIALGYILNSIVGRIQAEMNKSGLAQPYIYAKNLRKFIIPILPQNIQQKIADLVQKSHEARKKAKELLEEAKYKVEEIIEG